MSLSKRINDTNAAPWVIEEIRTLEDEVLLKATEAEAFMLQRDEARAERDALAARYAALADEVRAMIQDSDGLAGYHLNGDVACWSEFEVGHLLSEPDELGAKVLARRDALKQAEALEEAARRAPPSAREWLRELASSYRRQAEGESA